MRTHLANNPKVVPFQPDLSMILQSYNPPSALGKQDLKKRDHAKVNTILGIVQPPLRKVEKEIKEHDCGFSSCLGDFVFLGVCNFFYRIPKLFVMTRMGTALAAYESDLYLMNTCISKTQYNGMTTAMRDRLEEISVKMKTVKDSFDQLYPL